MEDFEKKEQKEEMIDSLSSEEGIPLTSMEQLWLNDISQYPLLTREEEIDCGKKLKLAGQLTIINKNRHIKLDTVLSNLTDGNAKEILDILYAMYLEIGEKSLEEEEQLLNRYRRKYKSLGRVLNEEELKSIQIKKKDEIGEVELLDQVKNFVQYNIARYKMIHSNMRLLVAPAKRYSYKTQIDFLDLASEGSMGLIKAVDRFDVDKNFRFSTYAMYWIRQHMTRYVSNNISSLKTGTNYWLEVKEFIKQVKELEESTGRKYKVAELAEAFGISPVKVLEYLNYNPSTVSLNQPVTDEEDLTLEDAIADEETDFIGNVLSDEIISDMDSYFKHLTPKEEAVIRLIYGINDEKKSYTQEEAAKKLKVTKSAVFQKHNRAMKKLQSLTRRNGEKDKLKQYL